MARVMNLDIQKEADSKQVDLDKIIDEYFIANKEKKVQDSIVKTNGEIIKSQLKEKGLNEFQGKNHKASITKSESIEYDEEKLLKLAKELPDDLSSQLVQKVEVVNLEKLERLIIEGKLEPKQFQDAEVRKTTIKLYVK